MHGEISEKKKKKEDGLKVRGVDEKEVKGMERGGRGGAVQSW